MTIVPLTAGRFDEFLGLVQALADYESLEGPDAGARERLRADAFGARPRFEAALALDAGGRAVGYAIWLEKYSTFRARPILHLEDIFVLESDRGRGAGGLLFEHVRALGAARGCCSMEWSVLDWNEPAREFYHRRGAAWLEEWLPYRLTY